jgi:hypothetical protein
VISEGQEDDDYGAVQAVHPRVVGSLVEDEGVRGKNQDLGLSLRWKNKSSPRLLPMVAVAGLGDQEGMEWGNNLFILSERRAVGFGRKGNAQDRFRKGWRIGLKGLLSSPAACLAQLEVGHAMRKVGGGGERRNGLQ